MVLGKGDNYLASKLTSTPMPDVIYYRLPCEPTPFETGEGIDDTVSTHRQVAAETDQLPVEQKYSC